MKNRVKIPKLLFFQEGPGVRNYQYTTEGVKLLNVANLVNGNLDLSTSERYISEEEAYGKYKHFLCDEGDLIIASSGIKVDYFDKKMGFVKPEHLPLCMNTSTIRFKSLDREVLDINYFMYFLKSQAFKKQLARQITGSAQLNFGPSHLSKMSFSLIDMEDQINIVKQLGKIELIIEMKTKQIQEYDQLIKSRFVDMFGNPIKNDKEWKLKFLDEVCDVRDGTHDSPKYYNVGYPLITSKNISNGNIDYSTAQLICEEDYQNINKRSKVDNGDILMPMIGTVGGAIIVRKERDFAIKNVALIKFNTKLVENTFIKYVLNSDQMNLHFEDLKKGGTQKFIGLKTIRNLPIIVPPIKLQSQFATFVQQVDKLKFEVLKLLRELR